MTAKMTRNILFMLVATVLMGIVLNLYIHLTGPPYGRPADVSVNGKNQL